MVFSGLLRHSSGHDRGYTVIELLVVVAIIAIITAIVIPNFLKSKDRATWAVAIANLRSVKSALAFYSVKSPDDTYPGTPAVTYEQLRDVVQEANLPEDANKAGWEWSPVSYTPSADRQDYSINIKVDIRNSPSVTLTPDNLYPAEFPY
jgi:prepilin-type N-terminal cleavage/methylation domain-containing protein